MTTDQQSLTDRALEADPQRVIVGGFVLILGATFPLVAIPVFPEIVFMTLGLSIIGFAILLVGFALGFRQGEV